MLQDTVETLKQTCFQGYPESAGCVQGSIDSRNSAIHSAYRISLRPSSLPEPRHPSLKVVIKLNSTLFAKHTCMAVKRVSN